MIAPASFHRNIPVSDLFNLPQQQEALARLKYVISSKGFGVFTGSPGTGKSSMVRFLESSLDKARYLFCYINDADLKPKCLYSRLLNSLSVQPSGFVDRMKKQFREAITNLNDTQGRFMVVVIDNAQDLPDQTIRELRYTLNFDMDSKCLLSLILVGQPELWDTLRLRRFEPVYQCITAHYRLPALDETQSHEYIRHQMGLSKTNMVFPENVVKRIYQFTHGIPRIINNICRHCLIDLESNGMELVDDTVLDRVLGEFQV
jgi:type II secretory pathway predicted ATPase ExeA